MLRDRAGRREQLAHQQTQASTVLQGSPCQNVKSNQREPLSPTFKGSAPEAQPRAKGDGGSLCFSSVRTCGLEPIAILHRGCPESTIRSYTLGQCQAQHSHSEKCLQSCVHMCMCVHTYMSECLQVCAHVCVYTQVCEHTYMYACICVYV